MRFDVVVEPHFGATFDDQLRAARHAEELGFDGFFRSDHYLTESGGDGRPGATDAWTTLAGIAVETSRIRLGTLVTPATFRLPGPLAITVAQVDQMSRGRVELGLGAGWFEAEHRAYGIPFPPAAERFERLAEQLSIVTGLWTTPPGRRFTFHGTHYRLTDSPALPKPVQSPRPPVIIGGTGTRHTPRLAARFADVFNVPYTSPDGVRAAVRRVTDACEQLGRAATGRPPIVLSVAQTVACGRTAAQARERAERAQAPAQLHGTPDRVAGQIAALGRLGITRIFLQFMDMADLGHLDLIASDVMPLVRSVRAPE